MGPYYKMLQIFFQQCMNVNIVCALVQSSLCSQFTTIVYLLKHELQISINLHFKNSLCKYKSALPSEVLDEPVCFSEEEGN